MHPHLFSCITEDDVVPGPYPVDKAKYAWVTYQNDGSKLLPPNLFSVGKIETGEDAYAARTIIENEIVPGYILKSSGLGYFSYDNEVHKLNNYQVLVVREGKAGLCWVEDTNCVNYNVIALKVGRETGELTLIGRTFIEENDCNKNSEGKICRY